MSTRQKENPHLSLLLPHSRNVHSPRIPSGTNSGWRQSNGGDKHDLGIIHLFLYPLFTSIYDRSALFDLNIETRHLKIVITRELWNFSVFDIQLNQDPVKDLEVDSWVLISQFIVFSYPEIRRSIISNTAGFDYCTFLTLKIWVTKSRFLCASLVLCLNFSFSIIRSMIMIFLQM